VFFPFPTFLSYLLSQRGHKAVDIDQDGGKEVSQRQLIAGCDDAGSARVITMWRNKNNKTDKVIKR